jgi:hypothetical protein
MQGSVGAGESLHRDVRHALRSTYSSYFTIGCLDPMGCGPFLAALAFVCATITDGGCFGTHVHEGYYAQHIRAEASGRER